MVFFLTFQRNLAQLAMILCYRNSIDMLYVEIPSDGLKTTYTIVIRLSKLLTLYLAVRHYLWYTSRVIFGSIVISAQSSSKLFFLIFADDTNMFYASNNLYNFESVMNKEFKSVVKYCAINKLFINFSKTNYILVSSSRLSGSINVNNIKIKSQIKYLGVYIDQHLHWGPQIKHINNKLAKNIGIITK